jgi:energy-coupling factor transport system ATP-binding protein
MRGFYIFNAQYGQEVSSMEVQEKTAVTMVEGTGSKYRWMAVTALMIAIGAILRIVSPSIAGITPNWTIAMYCLAIILVRPSVTQAAGIGLVAGAIGLVTSKSIFPYGNLVSELAGAVTCALILKIQLKLKVGKINFLPSVCAFFSTLFSGFVFVTVAKLALSLPMKVYLYGMLPVVGTVAVVNTVVTQLLYFPAYKIFSKGDNDGGSRI